MNNIKFELYLKKVKVKLNNGQEIVGVFQEDFEEEQQILIGSTIVEYDEVKKMELC